MPFLFKRHNLTFESFQSDDPQNDKGFGGVDRPWNSCISLSPVLAVWLQLKVTKNNWDDVNLLSESRYTAFTHWGSTWSPSPVLKMLLSWTSRRRSNRWDSAPFTVDWFGPAVVGKFWGYAMFKCDLFHNPCWGINWNNHAEWNPQKI